MGWFGNSNSPDPNPDPKEKLAEAKTLVESGETENIKKAIQIYRMYEHGLGNIVEVLESQIGIGPMAGAAEYEKKGHFIQAIKIYERLGKIEDKERVTRMMANDKIKHLDYDKAIEIYESIGDKEAAKNARKLKAEQGAVKVDQTVVQGDQITKTEIKDSVLNRSNVGSGGGPSKAEELREAKSLLDEGLINEDDYEKMKKEILGK